MPPLSRPPAGLGLISQCLPASTIAALHASSPCREHLLKSQRQITALQWLPIRRPLFPPFLSVTAFSPPRSTKEPSLASGHFPWRLNWWHSTGSIPSLHFTIGSLVSVSSLEFKPVSSLESKCCKGWESVLFTASFPAPESIWHMEAQ